MSRANVEAVRRAHDAWNRDDREAFLAEAHPELEWHTAIERAAEGTEKVRKGHGGIREAWSEYRTDAWERLEVQVDEYREVANSILCLGRMRVSGRTSGITTESEFAQLLTFRDGKIASAHDFLSHAEGLEAAGV